MKSRRHRGPDLSGGIAVGTTEAPLQPRVHAARVVLRRAVGHSGAKPASPWRNSTIRAGGGRVRRSQDLERQAVGLAAEILLQGGLEDRVVGRGLGEQRQGRAKFEIVGCAEDLARGASLHQSREKAALSQLGPRIGCVRYAAASAREAIAKWRAVSLCPSPAICGKMNHIQWLRLLPARSSARTRA